MKRTQTEYRQQSSEPTASSSLSHIMQNILQLPSSQSREVIMPNTFQFSSTQRHEVIIPNTPQFPSPQRQEVISSTLPFLPSQSNALASNTLLPSTFWDRNSVSPLFTPSPIQSNLPNPQVTQKEEKARSPYERLIKRNRRNRVSKKNKKSKNKEGLDRGKCGWCDTTETPEWRRGPANICLCNACGLQYRLKLKSERDAKARNSIYNLLNSSEDTEKAQEVTRFKKNTEAERPKRMRVATEKVAIEKVATEETIVEKTNRDEEKNSYKTLLQKIASITPSHTSFSNEQKEAYNTLTGSDTTTTDPFIVFKDVTNLSDKDPHLIILNPKLLKKALDNIPEVNQVNQSLPSIQWILTSPLPINTPPVQLEPASFTQQERNNDKPFTI